VSRSREFPEYPRYAQLAQKREHVPVGAAECHQTAQPNQTQTIGSCLQLGNRRYFDEEKKG
jgi:hypothetical protein